MSSSVDKNTRFRVHGNLYEYYGWFKRIAAGSVIRFDGEAQLVSIFNICIGKQCYRTMDKSLQLQV